MKLQNNWKNKNTRNSAETECRATVTNVWKEPGVQITLRTLDRRYKRITMELEEAIKLRDDLSCRIAAAIRERMRNDLGRF